MHFPDYIFKRDGISYVPVDEGTADNISIESGRDYLRTLGIEGEIVSTPSHSRDSISLILDDGDCIVGDLQPREYIVCYDEDTGLKADWYVIMNHRPKRILYAHMPEMRIIE